MGYSLPISYTIPAAATIPNLLTGTPLQYIGGDVKLTVYASCNTAGDTHSMTVTKGSEPPFSPIPLGPIPAASTASAVKTNENFVAQFAVHAGSVPQLTVNGTAAHTGQYLIVVD